jgi:hypothetical protein
MQRRRRLVSTALLLITSACFQRLIVTPPTPSDNSYLDLTPGSSLRILVPILSGGQNHLAFDSTQSNSNSLTITVANLAGYEVSHYLAQGHRNGRVHLKFTSAEITKDGHTVPEAAAPHLPFQFPNKGQFIRLVFLVRISESDHNMAIVTADTQDLLETFTSQIRQNPNACQVTNTVSCVWVPEGIAVRPQTLTDTRH